MPTARVTMLSALLLAFVLGGCGLFNTRDAEEPDSGRRSWETPRLPRDVLTNLSNALFERDAVNYLRSFAPEEFSFVPDPVALADNPSLAPWFYDHEANHIRLLLSEGTLPRDSLLFVIFASPEETILQDSAEILTPYELAAGVSSSATPHRMTGTAHFVLRVGAEGYWQIYRWEDRRSQEGATWSELKASVR